MRLGTAVPLPTRGHDDLRPIGPYYMEAVRRFVLGKVDRGQLATGGLRIEVALDPTVQAAADAGDADEAKRLDDALQSAYTALSCTVNPIPVKTAMGLLGFGVGDLRLPLVNATADEVATVRAELVARGLLG